MRIMRMALNSAWTTDMRLFPLLLGSAPVVWLFSCGIGSDSSSGSDLLTACRVYFDGDLAYCVETDTTEISERDCKDRMYQTFDGVNLLLEFAGRPDDKAIEPEYERSTSCPGSPEVTCEGVFLGDSIQEKIYESRFSLYCGEGSP